MSANTATDSEERGGIWARRTLAVSVVVALAVAVTLVVVSLGWPRSWDASVMEYAAWAVNHGSRPYRDVFDMNYPGSYLFYGSGQRLLGISDLSFRVRDVVVLGIALAAVHRLMRRFPWPAAPFAVVVITTQYLAVGNVIMSLQRDWLVAIGALGAIVMLAGGRRPWKLLLAGLTLGAAATIKPNAAIMIIILPCAFAIADYIVTRFDEDDLTARRNFLRAQLGGLGLVIAGALVAVSVALLWVIQSGGWSDFVWINRNYLPLYSRLDGTGIERSSTVMVWWQTIQLAIDRPDFFPLVLGAFVVVIRRRSRAELRVLLVLLALMAAGLVEVVSAGKGWAYHYWTWSLGALCFVAVGASDVHVGRWERWPSVPSWLTRLLSSAYLISFALWLVPGNASERVLHLEPSYLALTVSSLPIAALALGDLAGAVPRLARVPRRAVGTCATLLVTAALAFNVVPMLQLVRPGSITEVPVTQHELGAALRARLAPGDTVQILGTLGGHEAALEAEAQLATPFIYDFHFFHDMGSRVTAELRRRFIRDWRHHPPDFVILNGTSWSHRYFTTDLGQFPELVAELADYQVVYHTDQAEILERVPTRSR